MVPVFYHSDAEVAKQVIRACYQGGVRAFEFTNRGDFAHQVFAECVKFAASECPDMAIGICPHRQPLYPARSLLRSRPPAQP